MRERIAIWPLLGALSALLQSAPTRAQSAEASTPSTPISRTAGLELVDGDLQGMGDGYKVVLGKRGYVFTPALGAGAPRSHPIEFELLSITRDGTAMPLTSAAPRRERMRVEYDRGSVIERYDVCATHLAQSFVFTQRPSGSGDLVVRGRLTTDLDVATDGDGLLFTLPDVGSCSMSGVVGIDAAGRRATGSLDFAEGIVELSLPATFVDSAALPLVLDPLLAGASVVSGTGGADDRNPNVAFDAAADVFCVVWERVFSATDHDVYAQLVTRAGVPTGPVVFVETSTALATAPQIADCSTRGAFVVVFNRSSQVIGRAIDAATSLQGPALTLAAGQIRSDTFGSSCVASDVANGRVLCLWQMNTLTPTSDHIIQAASVSVGPSLALSVGSPRDVVRGATIGRPRVSKSDRGRNRHAVVFHRTASAGTVNAVLRVIDGNGAVLAGELVLSGSPSASALPEVDGDGTNWVAAWQPPNVVPTHHLECASVSFDPASSQLVLNGRGTFSPGLTGDFVMPRVTWINDSCLLGYAEQAGSISAAIVGSVDTFSCSVCENLVFAGVTTRVEGSPTGCAVRATGGTSEDALIAWEQALSGNGDIIARRWSSADGESTSLGGGCGRGGSNIAACARSPNFRFAHRLRDALPLAPTVFILSVGQASLPCGPCNLIPDLNGAISLVTATDLSGDASVPVNIPGPSPLVGVPLFTQWATIDINTPACSQLSLHLSDALRIVIQG